MKKEDFNNTCIYAKDEGDAKLIVEFYKSLGFSSVYNGNCVNAYYGVSEDGCIYFWRRLVNATQLLDFSVIEEYNKQDVPELAFPRMMNVWDSSDDIIEGLVVAYCKDIDFPWIVANDDSKSTFKFTGYKNSSEIVPTDITQKEIEEKLGYSINIVK
tara:strand:+ start:2334 stop:2804 length:471 start_codon:yes stop_codon:yes gene_type:complete